MNTGVFNDIMGYIRGRRFRRKLVIIVIKARPTQTDKTRS